MANKKPQEEKKDNSSALGKFFTHALGWGASVFIAGAFASFILPAIWNNIPKVDLLIAGMFPLVVVGVIGASAVYFRQNRVIEGALWATLFVGVPCVVLLYVYFGQLLAVIFGAVFLIFIVFLLIRSFVSTARAELAKLTGKQQHPSNGALVVQNQQPAKSVKGWVVGQAPTPPGAEPDPIDLIELQQRKIEAAEFTAREAQRSNNIQEMSVKAQMAELLKDLAANKDCPQVTWEHVAAFVLRQAQLKEPDPVTKTPPLPRVVPKVGGRHGPKNW